MEKAIGDLTGERFGYLKVIKQVDDIKSSSGKNSYKAWLCKCDCGNEIIVRDETLKRQTHYKRSCGCIKEKNPNYEAKHQNAQDIIEWEELYDYVNNNIMGYTKNTLSKQMIRRLKGLRYGQFIRNKNHKEYSDYSYKVILMTFKFSIPQITKALANRSFHTEENKFNYIMAIVESNLNTVYMRMLNAEKAKETTQTLDTATATHTGAEYQTKTTKASKKMEEYW